MRRWTTVNASMRCYATHCHTHWIRWSLRVLVFIQGTIGTYWNSTARWWTNGRSWRRRSFGGYYSSSTTTTIRYPMNRTR
uniref:Putative secreted protein n=1 Tax=Anopheles marajoara TaxID=58244 RepID=A0A2M4CBW8_9DIPT